MFPRGTHRKWPIRLWLAAASSIAGCSTAVAPVPPTEPTPIAAPQAKAAAPPPPRSAPVESTPVCEPLTVDVPALDDSMHQADELPIVDPTGRGLKSFHERLARLVRGRAKDHVRIGIYGDSNMTLDFIAGPMRRDLQLRYGDAGHGFIALARPWSHYRHMDVVQEVDVAFTSYAITTKPTGDGAYGYAGIASESPSIGARVRVATAPEGSPVGTRASRFDVFYLTGPRRGDFDVEVDGTSVASLSSEAEGRGVGIHRVEVEDGAHTFDSVIKSAKYVRFLGGVLERSKPGVVVDQLGVGAMSTRCIPMEDPAVSAPMLAFRRYDLVVLMTGTSDIYDLDKAPGYVREVVALHRSVNEDVSFLLVAPPDRGVSHAMNKLVTLGAQRKALASEIGVAFWDLLGAMGGPTSMMTFIRKGMALPDQIHFTEKGGAWVSKRLTRALLASFDAYVRNHPRAGCDEAGVEELEPWPKGSHVTPAGQLQPAGQEEPVRTVRYR